MRKRGLSDVVTTVLIILIVIAVIAILGFFVLNSVSDSSSNIEEAGYFGSLSIPSNSVKTAKYGSSSYVLLNVKKESSKGKITGANFVVEDESGVSYSKKITFDSELNQYETKQIGFVAEGVNKIKKISVSPVIMKSNNQEFTSSTFSDEHKITQLSGFQALTSTTKTPDGGLIITSTSGENTYLPSGLVGYWNFDEQPGTTIAKDSSGNGNDGVISNTQVVSFVSQNSISGNAAKFDRVPTQAHSGIEIPASNNNFDFTTGSFSLSGWIYIDADIPLPAGTVATNYEIVSNEYFVNYGWLVRVHNRVDMSTSEQLYIRTSKTAAYTDAFLSESNEKKIISKRWHHVAVVKDTGNTHFYIDGIKTSKRAIENPANSIKSFWIGGYDQMFQGKIDELMIFNKALTADEVEKLYLLHRFLGQTKDNPGASCKDILDKKESRGDGAYWIDTDGAGANEPIAVYCDMTTDGGGWTLISVLKGEIQETEVIFGNKYCTAIDVTTACKGKMPQSKVLINTEILVKTLTLPDAQGNPYWLVYNGWSATQDSGLRYFSLEKRLTISDDCGLTSDNICSDIQKDASLRIVRTSPNLKIDIGTDYPLSQWYRVGGWWVGAGDFSGSYPIHASSYVRRTEIESYDYTKPAGNRETELKSAGAQALFWR